MEKRLVLAISLAALMLTAHTFHAIGQDTKRADQDFVMKASNSNLAEIEHGKLAEEKASDTAVKDFARQMVTDHSKANQELEMIAKKKGYKMAMQMDKDHQAMQKKMQALQGIEFDRHYMMHMVESHQSGLKLYQGQANNGQDPDLKAFAAKIVPTVQKHLDMAKTIAGKIGATK